MDREAIAESWKYNYKEAGLRKPGGVVGVFRVQGVVDAGVVIASAQCRH